MVMLLWWFGLLQVHLLQRQPYCLQGCIGHKIPILNIQAWWLTSLYKQGFSLTIP
ncbi:hypothetical protein AAHE18_12G033200 [Arachis hypogaea]